MTQEEMALTLLRSGNGYLTAKEAAEHGISALALKRLTDRYPYARGIALPDILVLIVWVFEGN